MPQRIQGDGIAEQIAFEGLEVGLEHLDGGYSVCFESHTRRRRPRGSVPRPAR